MENQIQKKIISNKVNFYAIREPKFKTSRISFNIIVPLSDHVSLNALLPYVLTRSCKRYPDFKQLNQELEDLYGANLYADVNKLGEYQVLTIGVTFLNSRYTLNGEKLAQSVTKLMCEVIFNPNVEYKSFMKADVEQEKRQLIETIKAEYNDKRIYAKRRCEEIMFSEERYGMNVLGNIEEVQKIDGQDLYYTWEKLLQHAEINIMALGDFDFDTTYDTFKNHILKINRTESNDVTTEIIEQPKEFKWHRDRDKVAQTKVVMGFRMGTVSDFIQIMTKSFTCALLGGTPHSKLFLNVREKQGLCYYCSSSFDKNKGVMFVQSGVEHKNADEIANQVKYQINDLKSGKFTDSEIEATRLSLSNSYLSASDSLSALENFYLSQFKMDKIRTPKEHILVLSYISRRMIIEAAKQIVEDTTYILTAKEEK